MDDEQADSMRRNVDSSMSMNAPPKVSTLMINYPRRSAWYFSTVAPYHCLPATIGECEVAVANEFCLE